MADLEMGILNIGAELSPGLGRQYFVLNEATFNTTDMENVPAKSHQGNAVPRVMQVKMTSRQGHWTKGGE